MHIEIKVVDEDDNVVYRDNIYDVLEEDLKLPGYRLLSLKGILKALEKRVCHSDTKI